MPLGDKTTFTAKPERKADHTAEDYNKAGITEDGRRYHSRSRPPQDHVPPSLLACTARCRPLSRRDPGSLIRQDCNTVL